MNRPIRPAQHRQPLDAAACALQARLLERVSRTFALTIPRLPGSLVDVVGNAYLLCRIVDTVEDELPVDDDTKDALYNEFNHCLTDTALSDVAAAEAFATRVMALLPPSAPHGERELTGLIPDVLQVTARLSADERDVLRRCVLKMTAGMRTFETLGNSGQGLADVATLERYCYHVAGCVGEMLTELFCLHDDTVAARREALMPLSVAFGNGLQLTNILKDMWLDHARGVCWLPAEAFQLDGFPGRVRAPTLPELMQLALDGDREAIRRIDAGTRTLIGRCRAYLDDAMRYVVRIPSSRKGLRVFCLWSIGLSVLTLRKIRRDPVAARRNGTKIARSSVKATLAFSDASAGYRHIMQTLYAGACMGLPRAPSSVRVRLQQ